jgi:hypothetical protein
MELLERVRNFLAVKEPAIAAPVEKEKVLTDFEENDIYNTGAFFDDEYSNIFSARDKATILEAQKAKIMLYRNLAKSTDVNNGIEEIVNEIIYSADGDIVSIDIDEENDKIKEAIEDKFGKIKRLLNIDKAAYNLVRQSYIDGQYVIHCQYNNELSEGIQKVRLLEPSYFYFDEKSGRYKYHTKEKSFYDRSTAVKGEDFDKEEIIRETFGMNEGQINLSYMENAVNPANQMRVLEDLLIPMRFSRSISRRVFNVDIGELQNTKGEAVMNEMQKKFKYKKFYNTDTGEISNQQHITSMVEDYWFANRSGGKGTTVDTLDETGNLGEINDILYFQKKLYKAMFIPVNRISENIDSDQSFDYNSSRVTKEDIKFYMFINRIRRVYINLFDELLKRELISTGVMTLEQYAEYKEKIKIKFTSESLFIESMKISQFQSKLDIYSNVQEYNGKLFPIEKILKDIFKMDDEEIKENFAMIQKEKADPMFAEFYKEDDGY